jgi:hypothetical protein
MHDKVTRLRQLMSEALPREPQLTPAEVQARTAFAHYEINAPQPIVLEQSAQARAIRDIMRIASWYGWMGEVERALDAGSCPSLHSLPEEELDRLSARMRRLEDCAQNGMGAPDAPPAA